jgi:SMC interacting uncharacterized protein involved in chromosome segregation
MEDEVKKKMESLEESIKIIQKEVRQEADTKADKVDNKISAQNKEIVELKLKVQNIRTIAYTLIAFAGLLGIGAAFGVKVYNDLKAKYAVLDRISEDLVGQFSDADEKVTKFIEVNKKKIVEEFQKEQGANINIQIDMVHARIDGLRLTTEDSDRSSIFDCGEHNLVNNELEFMTGSDVSCSASSKNKNFYRTLALIKPRRK